MTDPEGVPWYECHRGCDPPPGLPVEASCVPCHEEERGRSVFDSDELGPEDYLGPDAPSQKHAENPSSERAAGVRRLGGRSIRQTDLIVPETKYWPLDEGEE